MDQIGDVGVPELVGCDMEIQAVDDFAVVCGFFTQNRVHGMDDLFTVFISGVSPFLGGAGENVLPDPFELSAGEGIAVPVGNDIFRGGDGLCMVVFMLFAPFGYKKYALVGAFVGMMPCGVVEPSWLFVLRTAPNIFLFSSVITAQYTGGECERGKQRRTGMP